MTTVRNTEYDYSVYRASLR